MNLLQDVLQTVPDTVKVAATAAAPALTFLGVQVEQWGYVISAIVGILFIIEKIPGAAKNISLFVEWVKNGIKRKK